MIFQILETFTLVSGLVYIFLQVRQNRWMWPIDVLCCFAAIVVFAHQSLWASMGLNIYYLVMGIAGWFSWKRDAKKTGENGIRIRQMSAMARIGSLLGFVASFVLLYWALKVTADPSPFADALVGASGIVGTVLLVRSYLENWYVWLFSDTLSLLLCFMQGLYFMAILYLVYTAMAVVGLLEWRRDGKYID